MAVDYYLKFDKITGESTAVKFEGNIDIESYSWGVTNTGSVVAAGAGGGAGKVSFQDIHFSTTISRASPQLFQYCARGESPGNAVLTAIQAGKSQLDFLTIKMSEVLISGYQTGGSQGEELPKESFSLNFAKVEIDYKPQQHTGALADAIRGLFDLKQIKLA